jgi:hypothetical protein
MRKKVDGPDERTSLAYYVSDFFCVQRTHARKLSCESIDAGLAGPQIQVPLTRDNNKKKT